MSHHLSLEQAIATCLDVLLEPCTELKAVEGSCYRVLAEELRAAIDYPPFSRSMVDGYAVHLDEKAILINPTQKYKILAQIAAGDCVELCLEPGQAAKVMTGAMLPAETDMVIKQEEALLVEDDVQFFHLPGARKHIQNAGHIISRGDVLGEKGDFLEPLGLERLVSGGIRSLKVFTEPTVGIINTGSELVPSGGLLGPGQIFNSNRPMLAALISRERCIPYIHNVKTPDQRNLITEELSFQLSISDLIIVTGGTAQGDFDLMEEALSALNAKIVFHHLQMKPGQGTMAALKDGKLIICLPGNPGAISLLFETLLVPILKRLRGCKEDQNHWFEVRLGEAMQKRMEQRSIRWGEIVGQQGDFYVKEAAHLNSSLFATNRVIMDLKPQQGEKLDVVRAMMIL